MDKKSAGYLSATSAYILWGLLPLYWRPLQQLPALGILAYRISFSFVFSWAAVLLLRRLLRNRNSQIKPPGRVFTRDADEAPVWRRLLPTLAAAALIGVNWFVYIWAVVNGYTIEASLGYFLTPMVNLLFGMIFLKERPGAVRMIALAISASAVAILTVNYGQPPVIALTLAFSFGTYGFIKKLSGFDSLTGMGLETGWLLLPALGVLFIGGEIAPLVSGPPTVRIMLVLAGPVTLAPLLLFASAAKRIPLYALGFFQYIAPSLMFLLGWLVFGEEVEGIQLIAFVLVWIALLIFSSHVLVQNRRKVAEAAG